MTPEAKRTLKARQELVEAITTCLDRLKIDYKDDAPLIMASYLMNRGYTRPTRFMKPTIDEVRAYINERNSGIDPIRFWDYYEALGWKIGNSRIKDWKAVLRCWERPIKSGIDRTNDIHISHNYTKEQLDALMDNVNKVEF